jgi:hypothetical protein
MSLQAAQALIVAKIQAVVGVGRVYQYQRLVTSESELFADTVAAGVLNYWTVTPAEASPHDMTRHPGTHGKAVYQYDVNAFMAESSAGASETAFVALIVLVMDAFEHPADCLGGAATEARPLQWQQHDYRVFGNVLCHHARLSMWVSEHPSS